MTFSRLGPSFEWQEKKGVHPDLLLTVACKYNRAAVNL